jgi:hypothetical protein
MHGMDGTGPREGNPLGGSMCCRRIDLLEALAGSRSPLILAELIAIPPQPKQRLMLLGGKGGRGGRSSLTRFPSAPGASAGERKKT